MTFQKYKSANNAQGVLHMPISSSATSMQLKSGEGDRFPSVFPYLLTAEQLDSLSAVIKREIVKVTNKVGDVFTIVRSSGTCLPDDTSTIQGTQAFSFDADSTRVMQYVLAEQIEDIQDEVERIVDEELPNKLDISEYQSGQYVYGASSGGSDSYAITLPNPPTAYEVGQTFRFQADVGNTGSASLNVNGLGAITIKKLHDQDLATGDIEAGQIVVVAYDGTNFQMNSQVALLPVIDVALSSLSNEDLLAGQSLIKGDFLFKETMQSFASFSAVADTLGLSYSSFGNTADAYGIRFQAKKNIIVNNVTKDSSCGATRALLKKSDGTLLETAIFSGNVATFTLLNSFINGEMFRIELDNNGSSFAQRMSSGTYTGTNVDVVSGSLAGSDYSSYRMNIADVNTTEAMILKNIGDTSSNSRLYIKAIGTGVSANTLNLALAKAGSPSVNLNLRIETDNYGNPSGSLFDVNATSAITPGSLSSTVQNKAITIGASILIPKGQPIRVGLFVGTYGSETINSTNYYKLGGFGLNSLIRTGKVYNGSSWSDIPFNTLIDSTGSPYYQTYTTSASQGLRIYAKRDMFIYGITKKGTVTAPVVRIISDDGSTVLATANFSGNTAYFSTPFKVTNGVYYRVEVRNNGANYTNDRYNTTWSSITGHYFNFTHGSQNGVNYNGSAIASIVGLVDNSYFMPYLISNLSELKLLSKTSALFSHMLPTPKQEPTRVSTKNYNIGELVKYDFDGISKQFTSIQDADYYYGDSPGTVSLSPGANSRKAGRGIASNSILIDKLGGFN